MRKVKKETKGGKEEGTMKGKENNKGERKRRCSVVMPKSKLFLYFSIS